MGSKALEVKRYIFDMLRADETLAAERFEVTWGWPAKGPPARWVNVGRVNWGETEWATNRNRNERFTVAVGFNVQMLAANAEEAEAFIRDAARTFEQTISNDQHLGGLCISTILSPSVLDSQPLPEGYEAQFELEVSCQARP